MEIVLTDLRVIFLKEIENLEKMGYEKIEVPVDYYWNIPRDLRYDPIKTPAALDIGQLSDDWQELQKIKRGVREPLAYHLVWLSKILEAIGEFTLG
jgi:hypothetical protein